MGLGPLRRHAAARAAAAAANPSPAPQPAFVSIDVAHEMVREALAEAEKTIAALRAAKPASADQQIAEMQAAHAAEIAALKEAHEREIEALTAPSTDAKPAGKPRKG